jgi:hypothetical protein
MWIKDEVLHVDRIVAASEQLIRFILKEIIDSKDEFYHDGHLVSRASVSMLWWA